MNLDELKALRAVIADMPDDGLIKVNRDEHVRLLDLAIRQGEALEWIKTHLEMVNGGKGPRLPSTVAILRVARRAQEAKP